MSIDTQKLSKAKRKDSERTGNVRASFEAQMRWAVFFFSAEFQKCKRFVKRGAGWCLHPECQLQYWLCMAVFNYCLKQAPQESTCHHQTPLKALCNSLGSPLPHDLWQEGPTSWRGWCWMIVTTASWELQDFPEIHWILKPGWVLPLRQKLSDGFVPGDSSQLFSDVLGKQFRSDLWWDWGKGWERDAKDKLQYTGCVSCHFSMLRHSNDHV